MISHFKGAQHFGPTGDHHVVADGRMALTLIFSCSTKSNTMVEQNIVSDLSGLANDDPHTVIDNKTASNRRAGVDFNTGQKPGYLRTKSGKETTVMFPKPMAQSVNEGGMDAGIEQEDFQPAPGGRVSDLIGPQSFAEFCQLRYLPTKNASYAGRHKRRQTCRGSTLIFHSKADNGGWPAGIHIPLAPGRNSHSCLP
jgi:hypothetical protein